MKWRTKPAKRVGGWVRLGLLLSAAVLCLNAVTTVRDYVSARAELERVSRNYVYAPDRNTEWTQNRCWSRPWSAGCTVRVGADMTFLANAMGRRPGVMVVDRVAIAALVLGPLLVIWVFVPILARAIRWVADGFKLGDRRGHKAAERNPEDCAPICVGAQEHIDIGPASHNTGDERPGSCMTDDGLVQANDIASIQTTCEISGENLVAPRHPDPCESAVVALPPGGAEQVCDSISPGGGCLLYFALASVASLVCGVAYVTAVDYFLDQGQSLALVDFIPRSLGSSFFIYVVSGIPVWIAGLVRRSSKGRFSSPGLLYVWITLMVVLALVAFSGTRMRYDLIVR